ncbi:putative DNA polymerase [Frankliniella fusca]|uniref:DNA-directed DNA polymerase n=1 Tax=Frankliniella fusca TaxID=407009 RepID=A0AAE1LTL7_9NEOP|nr:putative DNA polymerase [Frankliniella fusca]
MERTRPAGLALIGGGEPVSTWRRHDLSMVTKASGVVDVNVLNPHQQQVGAGRAARRGGAAGFTMVTKASGVVDVNVLDPHQQQVGAGRAARRGGAAGFTMVTKSSGVEDVKCKMPSVLTEILVEWVAACFHSDELLAEAYTVFLANLVEASVEERADPRVIPFLLVGYTAYRRYQDRDDPHVNLTYRMALAMCGAGSNAPPRPATPPPRPATPPAGPSRARSPQPGPSKRPREEDEKPEEDQPTLEVLQSRERELNRFKTKFRENTIQISGLGDTLPSEEVMEGLFDTVLQRQREAVSAKDDDRVIVEIQNAENVDNPLWFSMRRADQINGRVVLDKLARVFNSNQAFMAQGQLKVSYIHIPTPEAGGRRTNRVANETIEQWIKPKTGSKGSIYSPENTDNILDDPNLNVMSQFFDYLQSFGPKTKILLAAHNSRSFDGVFVTQEAVKRKLKYEVTLQGAKILCMEIGLWKFIESLMFLPMPLSAMPKSFGLTELKKGYWPFMANKPEFYTYEGPLLDKHFYCVSTMNQKAVGEFNASHDEQTANGFVYNFRRELIDYCISDVTILRQACHAFRSLFEQTAGFEPMFNCMTLSSACMAAFRRNFLKPDTIGIVPPGCYHGRGKQSHIALKWLDYESHKLGTLISTIYTDREISVLGRRVDGYIELPLPDGSLERRIYQFHGCYWHYCPIHFPANEDSGENRFEKTQQLTSLFRRSGYTVIEKWECEFKSDLASDPDTKAYFEAHPTTRTPPPGLRDALAGGRTSALKWYYKADLAKGEKIKMVDVVSEYPNANLRGEYPYGHPTLYLEGDPDMPPPDTWNGVIKCTVLPPRDLYLPVFPYKAKGKLMFPLCRTCVEQENTEVCHHNDPQERQLTDTWCAPELLLALREKGYTLVEVHEVYQYPRTSKYNPDTREDGLLSAYVRRFMALKIQASGWPPECDTEEKQAKFVEDTLKHDGVVLDPTKMEKNPALRALSKLMLNSFWGKFGEKTLRPKTEFLYDYAKLIALVTDNTKEVTGLLLLSDECLQVTWKPVEDSEVSLPTSSLRHAAYTTCHGCMQLYKYLDVVKERALYHDTDSVAYISRPGESELPLGTHLGDLTDQIEEEYGPGSFITEFVAGGPKNYAYKVAVGGDVHNIKVCIKVRGISINTSCDDLVTFDNLKVMVMGSRDKITVPIPHQIARLPGWRIVTRHSTKNWQALNTKRRRLDVANTVPHGYNAWTMAPEEDQDLLEVMELLGDA